MTEAADVLWLFRYAGYVPVRDFFRATGDRCLRILLDHYSYSNPHAVHQVIKAPALWLVGR
jgi:hypothetical protein